MSGLSLGISVVDECDVRSSQGSGQDDTVPTLEEDMCGEAEPTKAAVPISTKGDT